MIKAATQPDDLTVMQVEELQRQLKGARAELARQQRVHETALAQKQAAGLQLLDMDAGMSAIGSQATALADAASILLQNVGLTHNKLHAARTRLQ